MKNLLSYLLLLTFTIACKKADKIVKLPELPGSISGTAMPITAVQKITVVSDSIGSRFYETGVDAGSGKFYLPNVPKGSYTLNFLVEGSFNTIEPIKIQVQAGKDVNAGTITTTAKPIVVPEEPVNTTSISGTLSPKNAAGWVTASSVSNLQAFTAKIDTATGNFTLSDILPGNYVLQFRNDTRPIIKTVSVGVASMQHADLGTVFVSQNAANYSISAAINGVPGVWIYKTDYTSSRLYIGPQSVGSFPEDKKTRYFPAISLKDFNGVGTYACNPTTKNTITYSGYLMGSGLRISHQSTEFTGGEGTVEITSIDPETKTIKGTFSGTLATQSGQQSDTKIITNGVINAKY